MKVNSLFNDFISYFKISFVFIIRLTEYVAQDIFPIMILLLKFQIFYGYNFLCRHINMVTRKAVFLWYIILNRNEQISVISVSEFDHFLQRRIMKKVRNSIFLEKVHEEGSEFDNFLQRRIMKNVRNSNIFVQRRIMKKVRNSIIFLQRRIMKKVRNSIIFFYREGL